VHRHDQSIYAMAAIRKQPAFVNALCSLLLQPAKSLLGSMDTIEQFCFGE
jgi:hypothetical protein